MNQKWIEIIESAWENRALLNNNNTKNTIRSIIEELDKGKIRVAYKHENQWQVNDWVKKAIILYFPIQEMKTIEIGALEFHDKMELKKNLLSEILVY